MATGWAVKDKNGINVRSVFPTKSGAIRNWLWIEQQINAPLHFSDAEIEKMWEAAPFEDARPVEVYIEEKQ